MKFDFPDESVITEVADNKIIFSADSVNFSGYGEYCLYNYTARYPGFNNF